MKRISSLFLSVVMMLMMIIPVYAADDGWEVIGGDPSISIVNTTKNHTYNAYQIFTGDLARKQREVPDPNDTSSEPPVYKEYSVKVGGSEIHLYLNGSKYYYVSNGEEYTGSTATVTPVYEQALRSLKWGSGITDDGIIALYRHYVDNTAVVPAIPVGETLRDVLQDSFQAEDVAQKIRGTEDSGAVKFANFIAAGGEGGIKYLATFSATANGDGGTAKLNVGHQGYYMITEDAANNTLVPDVVDETIAYSRYIIRVAGTVVIEPKSDAPKVIKKVYDNHFLTGLSGDLANEDAMIPGFDLDNGSTTPHNNVSGKTYPAHPDGASGGWNDVADYSVGDNVPFKLIGTLPNTYTGYYNYKYVFHDILTAGYTINTESIHMYVMNGDSQVRVSVDPVATGKNVTWEIVKNDDGTSRLSVRINNTKLIDETGVSNDDDSIKQLINENSKIVVEYVAKLNYDANVGTVGNESSVYLEFSNNPNPSDVITTSRTSRDEVVVFTYLVEGIKIAAQQQSQTNLTLAGAEFKLRREDGKWYRLNTSTVGGKTVYDVTWEKEEDDATVVKSNGSGLFTYRGLDDGTYYLKEVVAPYGYVIAKDEFKFDIHSDIDNSQSYNGTPASVWANGKKVTAATEGALQSQFSAIVESDMRVILTVTNSEEKKLPLTGGEGVYLFYIVGGLFIIMAMALLVLKKKKESK